MANLSPWIILALVTMLVVLLVKMNRLYGELDLLKNRNEILKLEEARCRSSVRKVLMSVAKKEEESESSVQEAKNVFTKIQKQLSEVQEELANKGIAYDNLQQVLDETKKELEVKKSELAKAGAEAERFQTLYLQGNSRLTALRDAYEKLRHQVMTERLMMGERRASTARELTKKQARRGAAEEERHDVPAAQTHDMETQQRVSLAARLTKNQEQEPNYANEGQQPQQEKKQKQQEAQQQEAQQQTSQQQQQQVEGNRDDAGNEREVKGREQGNEEGKGVEDDEREKDKEASVSRP